MDGDGGARAGYPMLTRLGTQVAVTVTVGGVGIVAAALVSGSWLKALGVVAIAAPIALFYGLGMWWWLRGKMMRTVERAPYAERPVAGGDPSRVRVAVGTAALEIVGLAVALGVFALVGDEDPRDPSATGLIVGILLGSALLNVLQVRHLRRWEAEQHAVIHTRAGAPWAAWTAAQARDRLVLVRT